MRRLLKSTLFILILLLFNQCNDYDAIEIKDITVDEVKMFYQNLPSNPQGRQNDIGITWENGIYKDLIDGDALLFPLETEGSIYVSGGENTRRFSVETASLAFAYKESDNISLEQIQMVPTTNSDPFTGFVTVSDWGGELKHIFHFKDGVFQEEPSDNNGRIGGLDCTTTHYWWCTDTGAGEDPCTYNGSSTSCTYTNDLGIYDALLPGFTKPDGSGNGGTGGSSGADENNCTSPLDPLVDVPCNENTCGDGYEPDGDGGCREECTGVLENNVCMDWESWINDKIEEMQEQMDCNKLKSSQGKTRNDIWDFYDKYKGWKKEDITHERPDQYVHGIGPIPGGPLLNFRYVEDPLNSNIIIDMRHLLIIGEMGRVVGESAEYIQWLGSQESAFDDQDYYSNELGYKFYQIYGDAIDHSSDNIVDFLITFLYDETLRNNVSNPERCKN